MEVCVNENPPAQAQKALFGDTAGKIKTFALLSAENPMNTQLSCNENKERMDSIEADMKKLGLQYTKVTGMYNSKENSFIIYNISYNDALFLASVYAQESFFFAKNDFPAVITYYETSYDLKSEDDVKTLKIPESTYKEIETSRKISNEADAANFFSDFRYSFDMDYFKESVAAVCDSIINENYEYYINRAIDDKLTAHGRANARRKARRNF